MSINQFKPVQQIKKQTLRAYCPNIYIYFENRPEYVGLWLGCSKIGLVPALINSNLAGQSLLHSINAACARAVICGGEFLEGKKKF